MKEQNRNKMNEDQHVSEKRMGRSTYCDRNYRQQSWIHKTPYFPWSRQRMFSFSRLSSPPQRQQPFDRAMAEEYE